MTRDLLPWFTRARFSLGDMWGYVAVILVMALGGQWGGVELVRVDFALAVLGFVIGISTIEAVRSAWNTRAKGGER